MPVIELNQRSRAVFRQIVDAYLETGEPIGSRTLAKRLEIGLSPATIRNVMADLEDAGLLYAPHTSAGRMPTEAGLRWFVNGLLEVGDIGDAEREELDQRCAGSATNVEGLLEKVTATLSGLSHCASVVMAPKAEGTLRYFELVNLAPGRALAVLVHESGIVENRIIETPPDLPASALIEASNYLSARTVGRSLDEARRQILVELEAHEAEIDALASKVVESGLAIWTGDERSGSLIVRGQAHLLDDVQAIGDLEHIRRLFAALETKEAMIKVLSLVDAAEGVQIFIGAGNDLFNLAGCSLVLSPYRDSRRCLIGAIGVIGPTRMNYARIIPMVDYTARLVGRIIG